MNRSGLDWRAATYALLKEAWSASLPLIKITVPVVILVRIFHLMGLNVWINQGLSPFMTWVGLPPEAGIVWASALVGNLYSAFLVFLSHAGDLQLTVSQVTVLMTMVLVAHSFPMELRVTQLVGIRVMYMGCLRFFGAIVTGWVLTKVYASLGLFQTIAPLPALSAQGPATGWADWALGEVRNLFMIYFIVLALILLMKILRLLRVDVLLEYVMWPLNALLKTDQKTTSFNVIGMIAGISYGGALMMNELKQRAFTRRDILVTMTFMGLAHGLIEETLLMMALGAHWSGVLLGRLLLAVAAAFLLGGALMLLPVLVNSRLLANSRLRVISN
ncbi:hypothetical protein [Chitinivorax sp. B]|uniref:hypothetical protein n=1 Tax=Chitinivorax sp. B TaxID=2502235 RepID=UPI0010F93FB9|nr:hypothetical protein [Chitinivorax sp. B]